MNAADRPLSKALCDYCGREPQTHRRSKIRNTRYVIVTTISQILVPYSAARFARRLWELVARTTILLLLRRGIASRSCSRGTIRLPRARALFDEAERSGIRMCAYTINGTPLDYYDAHFADGRSISFFGLPRPPKFRHRGERWMDDKGTLKKRLRAAGIPVAAGCSYSNYHTLRAAYAALTKPVVLKPRRGSMGNHTTTAVSTEFQLHYAYCLAKQLCHFVVMEEHLDGPVCRATVIAGRVVGLLIGEPPRITGDGVHTVAELIQQKNKTRTTHSGEVRVTNRLLEFLYRCGYSLKTVLPKHKTIDLSASIGVRHGGASYECLDDAHPDLLRTLENAARVVDDPIIGFDFIMQDITKDPRTQRWGIIEANSLPFIHLHNEPALGTTNNVTCHVWDLWK